MLHLADELQRQQAIKSGVVEGRYKADGNLNVTTSKVILLRVVSVPIVLEISICPLNQTNLLNDNHTPVNHESETNRLP